MKYFTFIFLTTLFCGHAQAAVSAEDRLMNDVNSFFSEKVPEMFGSFKSMSSFRMNLLDGKDSYHIDAEVPGVKKEDLKVELQGDTLVISGDKKSYLEQNKNQYKVVERSNGKFSRAFTLPPDADKSKITSKLEDGVLKIDIGKQKNVKPSQQKQIEIL